MAACGVTTIAYPTKPTMVIPTAISMPVEKQTHQNNDSYNTYSYLIHGGSPILVLYFR